MLCGAGCHGDVGVKPGDYLKGLSPLTARRSTVDNMPTIEDAPGMLRVKLREHQKASGSGNDFATVLVVAEHADRAAFARQALAIKLRELDAACAERDKYAEIARLLVEECRVLAIHCERHDADLDAAINGTLRRAR